MSGGFYHTGDVARLDADGYITYIGRTDDVFKASDYKISPFELESVLIEHPAVAEAAVVPAPDPIRLAVPKAVCSAGARLSTEQGDRAGHPALRARAPGTLPASPARRVLPAPEDDFREDSPGRAASAGGRPRGRDSRSRGVAGRPVAGVSGDSRRLAAHGSDRHVGAQAPAQRCHGVW